MSPAGDPISLRRYYDSPAQSWTEDTRSKAWYVAITLQDYASGAIRTHGIDLEGRYVNQLTLQMR